MDTFQGWLARRREPRAGWSPGRSGNRKGPRGARARRPFCARPYFQSLRGAVAWTSGRGRMPLSSRYGDAKHPELLSWHPGGEAVERRAHFVGSLRTAVILAVIEPRELTAEVPFDAAQGRLRARREEIFVQKILRTRRALRLSGESCFLLCLWRSRAGIFVLIEIKVISSKRRAYDID